MATRRKRSEPPPIETKQFTLQEIDRGIIKLRRRIDEVKALETDQVTFNDQRRDTAQQNIRKTILEVFSPNSPEYQQHQYYEIWGGPMIVDSIDADMSGYEAQQYFLHVSTILTAPL